MVGHPGAYTDPMDTTQPHISTDAAVNRGRPSITGTTITVTDVFGAVEKGYAPASLVEHFRAQALTHAQIYAALTYYYDHTEELAAAHAAEQADLAAAEKLRLAEIKRRFMGQ